MEPKGNDMAGELVAWLKKQTLRTGTHYTLDDLAILRELIARLSLSRSTSTDAVAVKALDWEQPDGPSAEPASCWLGHGTDWCQYYIGFKGGSWWMPFDSDDAEQFDSIEAAKAAAQADYERRIRSALACPSLQGGAEPVHIEFRRQALAIAATLDGADFAGDIDVVDGNTAEGLARTVAIVVAAYDWTFSDDGTLVGLVAGDQGWATTGIKIDPHSLGETGGTETGATPDVALSTLEYYLSEAENGWCKIPRRVVDDAVQSLASRASSLAAEKLKVEELEDRIDELEREADTVSAEFERECTAAVGRLLKRCHYERDVDGWTAGDAEEYLLITMDEIEKAEKRNLARAEALDQRVAALVAERDLTVSVEQGKIAYRDKLIAELEAKVTEREQQICNLIGLATIDATEA